MRWKHIDTFFFAKEAWNCALIKLRPERMLSRQLFIVELHSLAFSIHHFQLSQTEESLTLMFGHKSALHLTLALKLASAPTDDSIENWWTFRWRLAIWFCWAKPLFAANRASFASREIVVLHYCVSRQETRIRKEVNINALIEPLRDSSWTSTFVESNSFTLSCASHFMFFISIRFSPVFRLGSFQQ